jgi:hypothetical protein
VGPGSSAAGLDSSWVDPSEALALDLLAAVGLASVPVGAAYQVDRLDEP